MSIKIYCFTGTGNSLSIARQLAQPMRAEVVRLDLSYYGEQASETCVSEGDIIGFVFPVYAWSYPDAVKAFVKKLKVEGRPSYVFAVADCGDSAGETLTAFSRLLEKQGLRLDYGNICAMPNNYLPLSNVDNKAMERTKLENARVRCTKIAKDIEERLVGLNSLPPKAIDPFLLHVVHPLFCQTGLPEFCCGRRLHRLRPLREGMPAEKYSARGRAPRVGKNMRKLHGLHSLVPSAGDSIRQKNEKLWPVSQPQY